MTTRKIFVLLALLFVGCATTLPRTERERANWCAQVLDQESAAERYSADEEMRAALRGQNSEYWRLGQCGAR